MSIPVLKQERGTLVKRITELAPKTLSADEATEFEAAEKRIDEIDAVIKRIQKADALQVSKGHPVEGTSRIVPATVENDPYVKDKSLIVGGIARVFAATKGDAGRAMDIVSASYGESHPVTDAMGTIKAQMTNVGATGGWVVPPDYYASIIPLLYALAVLRKAGVRTLPMPNGTMTLPKMTGGSSATWVGEAAAPGETGPTWGQIVATARKLMALVPISNDMLRYALPGYDQKVRDDLVMQIALAEDIAGLRSLGTKFTPRGLKSFLQSSQTITSTSAYTLPTVVAELGGLRTKLQRAKIPMRKPVYIMEPRTEGYLMTVLNSLGNFVFKDEMAAGKVMLTPYFSTAQLPINLSDGTNSDCTEVYMFDANEFCIYESRQIELAVATEASYVDASGTTQNAFAQDMSIIRAITAEDFQMDHDEGVAMVSGVRWAPKYA